MLQQTKLTELSQRIEDCHRAVSAHARITLESARDAGEHLKTAKGLLQHGEFGEWLKTNFSGSARTARNYMRIADNWSAIESKMAESAVLSIDGALKSIAAPAPADVDSPLTAADRKLFKELMQQIEDGFEQMRQGCKSRTHFELMKQFSLHFMVESVETDAQPIDAHAIAHEAATRTIHAIRFIRELEVDRDAGDYQGYDSWQEYCEQYEYTADEMDELIAGLAIAA